MAELKTKETAASVDAFVGSVQPEARREDVQVLLALMREVTGAEPRMWGKAIVGFGQYHFHYASGREGDWFVAGFSPRKQSLVLYIMPGFSAYDGLLSRLGKHSTGKSCLYVKRLADIDMDVLRELVEASVAHMRATYD